MTTARHFEELELWQLAMEVKRLVFELTQRGQVCADRDFRDQIRAAAAAAPRNIAEGFNRFTPREFANKIRIALGELGEAESCLMDGAERGYFHPDDLVRARHLIQRTRMVGARFCSYLDGCAREGVFKRNRDRR